MLPVGNIANHFEQRNAEHNHYLCDRTNRLLVTPFIIETKISTQ